ncbi:MAG: methylated-DNA--[protein]-cysteine S-methyltransferase [Planctomycetota bacterium]|jgi:methylated-DNA-[protein]-cysteine S-methyltransferase
MMENYQYSIFKTRWGWFGLLGSDKGLVRTCLTIANKEAVIKRMLSDMPDAKQSTRGFSVLKKAIQEYYKGTPIDFSDARICLDGFTEFQQKALATLRKVKYGKTLSYSDLAKLAGNPKAARAIGSVMAANPLPLIIPCHRVIRTDGVIGQFSAAGGQNTKKRMLKLENQGG